jgi:hypothetical protein
MRRVLHRHRAAAADTKALQSEHVHVRSRLVPGDLCDHSYRQLARLVDSVSISRPSKSKITALTGGHSRIRVTDPSLP